MKKKTAMKIKKAAPTKMGHKKSPAKKDEGLKALAAKNPNLEYKESMATMKKKSAMMMKKMSATKMMKKK
jgi:hypothetical protein